MAPTGLALAAIYLLGWRVWPGIFVGSAVANWSVFAGNGDTSALVSGLASLAVGAGNTLEAVVGVALWRRFVPGRHPLDRVGDLLRCIAALPLACAVSAGIGAASVWLAGTPADALPGVWLTWWLGDIAGGIVVAPFLLSWGRRARPLRPSPGALLALVATLLLTHVLFGGMPAYGRSGPLSYLLLLPLLWIAFRHGQRETATAVLLVCTYAVWATIGGRGPFVLPDLNASLLLVQSFVAVVTLTMLSLAAALTEQQVSERRLQQLAGELERRVEERTAELSQANQQLQQAQKMEAIGTLAGGIAHDFNNLLTAIMGGLHMAQADLPVGAPAREALAIADQASHQAADLVAQLLTLGRKRAPSMRPVDVGGVIADTSRLLARSLPAHIEIRTDLPDVPSFTLGDAGQLGQALLNLGINARDAMPDGGKLVLSVKLETLDEAALERAPWAKPGHFVVASVEDDGQGMSPEVVEHIFEPFFTTKASGQGTGLGLAMVYTCVHNHGGVIRTRSAPGRGTRFDLCLPETAAPAVGAVATPARAALPAAAAARVLVIDDVTGVLESSALILRNAGYRVTTAADVDTALRALDQADGVDAIVTDMVMPGKSGRQLLAAVRKRGCQAPVILSSGHGVTESLEALRREGFADFLPKPFAPDALTGAVARACMPPRVSVHPPREGRADS